MHSFQKDRMTLIPVRATVREVEVSEAAVRQAINLAIERANKGQKQDTAAVDPVGENQKPRMLQISAWICHAGKPNLNRQSFVDTDLADAVGEGLFRPPYFGMIDYNHDFNSYGAWYNARYAFDHVAQQWGILAEGAIFAWRYTDLADKMLAMQQRLGFIEVSMACMPGSYEERQDENGTYYALRKPVFFTTSVLDVDPADPKARGLGSEDPNSTNEMRSDELLSASVEDNTKEAEMDNAENKEAPEVTEQTEVAEVAETVAEVTEQAEVTETVEVVEEVAVVAETVEAVQEVVVVELTPAEQLAVVLAEVEVLKTARQTAEVALTAAQSEMATMLAELTELRAMKEASEKAARDAEAARVRAARMAEIPAHIAAALENEEGQALIEKWMEQSEETWTMTKKVFAVASSTRKTAAERSAEEGVLTTATDERKGDFAINRWKK